MEHKLLYLGKNQAFIDKIKHSLNYDAIECSVSNDPLVALSIIRDECPSLVVVESQFTQNGGLDFCRMLNEMDVDQPIYVFWICNTDDSTANQSALRVGASEVIASSISATELYHRVCSALQALMDMRILRARR